MSQAEQRSFSFDPVANHYDATRGYPQEVSRKLAEALDQTVGGDAQTRFLEVGVGTGRIAIPLAALGCQYTGIDISEKMLGRLCGKLLTDDWQEWSLPWGSLPDEDKARKLEVWRFTRPEKRASLRLLIADMTEMPFHNASFDVVVAVHVFHLVPVWQQALREVLRVLRPGGMLLRVIDQDWDAPWQPGLRDIRSQWHQIVEELGGSTKYPGATDEEVTDWLEQEGLKSEQWPVISWQQSVTPRAIFEEIAQRIWTRPRLVPDNIFSASIERLRKWVDEHYGAALDEASLQERRILISKTSV